MDNSTDLAVDIVLKGIFTLTSILGIIPNVIIIFLFYKTQKEMQSYGVFQISFATTELVCTIATWLTMNRYGSQGPFFKFSLITLGCT